MKLSIPETPTMFLKATETINHPSGHIIAPHCADLHDCHLDYEVELAVVIGKTCKDVSEHQAMEYVLGYMTANDVTARTHQNEVSQWDRGKGFDGFAPIGPALVSSKIIPDPSVLKLQTILNGQVMQQGEASDMIFTVPKIVSFLSQVSYKLSQRGAQFPLFSYFLANERCELNYRAARCKRGLSS